MGFTNAIYKFPKYKETTLNQIFNIESYYSYDKSDWAKNNFPNAEEYMDYNDGRDKSSYIKPTNEQLEFYKSFLHKDDFDGDVIHQYVYNNCSYGIPFQEDIQEVLETDYEHCNDGIELHQNDIIKLLNFEIKKLDKYKIEAAYIDHSYSYINSDDEFEDEPDIILKKCDGIEVVFAEDNLSKRIDTNSEHSDWGTLFMTNRNYIDEDEYATLFNLVKTLSDILVNTDFETEVLVYCGGW